MRSRSLAYVAGGVISLSLILGLAWALGWIGKPRTQRQQVSYTLGAQFARSLRVQDLDLDSTALARGLKDGLKAEQVQLTEDEMQEALKRFNIERQQAVRELAKENRQTADDFLSRNRVAEGVKTTSSGLQYKILTEGKGTFPKPTDIVQVKYRATLTDGTLFDSSNKRSTPAEFPLNGVIPGWSEGLRMLKKGGKAVFFIPPELGYGDRPQQKIPPNSVLIFDVELLDIKPAGSSPDKSPSARSK